MGAVQPRDHQRPRRAARGLSEISPAALADRRLEHEPVRDRTESWDDGLRPFLAGAWPAGEKSQPSGCSPKHARYFTGSDPGVDRAAGEWENDWQPRSAMAFL